MASEISLIGRVVPGITKGMARGDRDLAVESIGDPFAQSARNKMANNLVNDILETAMDIAESKSLVDINDIAELESIMQDMHLSSSSLDPNSQSCMHDFEPSTNLGVGDSPPPKHILELPEPNASKAIERKRRFINLATTCHTAMNSLLSEEQRKKQDDWEENNEIVIQVVELHKDSPCDDVRIDICPEELSPIDNAVQGVLLDVVVEENTGEMECSESVVDTSLVPKKSGLCSSIKRRKWSFNFKSWCFRKNRKAEQMSEEAMTGTTAN